VLIWAYHLQKLEKPMGCRNLCALLIGLSLAAGCGNSPSSPSSVSSNSSVAAESAVMSAMAQAMSQTALAGRTIGDAPNTFTVPCAGGGSMVMTMNPLPQQGNVFRSSSRIEFRDCKNQTVTINGDPYLDTSIELSFSSPAGGTSGDSVSTMRTTGGMRMNSNGVQGRVQFNCTTTVSISMVNGSSHQVSVSSTGTTTFEQPLGSTPVVRACGPG
jgi:hypothetical protein